MKEKIFVSTFPFARTNKAPLEVLEKSGFEIILNNTGKKISGKDLTREARGCHGIIAGTEDLRDLIENSSDLRIISRVGIGLDSVPLQLCKEKNIAVSYTPEAVSYAVAELTLGMMINLTRYVSKADQDLRNGGWNRFQGKGLNESVIGLIGFGRIGQTVAKLLAPFRPLKLLVNDVKPVKLDNFKQLGLDIEHVDKETLYKTCDIVSLHIPNNRVNRHLIAEKQIASMKADAFLINTARGGLIEEESLYRALSSQQIQGAGIDTFEQEPYKGPLLTLPNVILTQHMGSCSDLARLNMERDAAEDVVRFLKGEPLKNPVPEEEYFNQ